MIIPSTKALIAIRVKFSLACLISPSPIFVATIALAVLGVINKTKPMIFGAVACAVVFVLLQSVSIVPSGASGVIVTLGKVHDTTLESGLNFKAPFVQKVVVIDNKIQRTDVQGEASSKDLQIVNGGQTTASIANTLLTSLDLNLKTLICPRFLSNLHHQVRVVFFQLYLLFRQQ